MPQPLDTAAIQARHDNATSGTWYLQPHYGPDFVAAETAGYEHGIGTLDFGVGDQADADREFVLNAHNDIGALLARVAELEQQLAAHQAAIAAVRALDEYPDETEAERAERYQQYDPDQYHEVRAADDTLWDVMRAIDTALGTPR